MTEKKSILFVDDEPNVLEGLRRMLRKMSQEWDMTFAENGDTALALMAQHSFDVIVSDMRMPGMSGDELLEKVMNLYPQTVRIVLSGHSDREMILKSVRTAHQYLAKPCDAEMLRETISRALNLRRLLTGEDIQIVVSKMESLPSLPSLYTEIMNELQSSESTTKSVGKIIEKDIGMSAKILQLVNSAFFALPRQIHSPSQAVALLGLETVKALVLSVRVFSQFQHKDFKSLSLNSLWQHSMTVGQYAQLIYKEESTDENIIGYALIAGMLHDVGKLILVSNFPEKYDTILHDVLKNNLILSEIEYNEFGVSHGEVGAYMLGLWGLPDLIVEALAYHNMPSKSPETSFTPLTAVHAANIFEHEIFPKRRMGVLTSLDMEYLAKLGLHDKVSLWQEKCRKSINKGAIE